MRLDSLAAHENHDGEPYDTMVEAATELRRLRALAHNFVDNVYGSASLEAIDDDHVASLRASAAQLHDQIDNPPTTKEHATNE